MAAVVPPVQPVAPPPPVQPAVGTFPSEGARPLSTEAERALGPKDVFKECDICPEMVVVPAGSFTMGSRASETGRSDNEGPQHAVKIAKAVRSRKVSRDGRSVCSLRDGDGL